MTHKEIKTVFKMERRSFLKYSGLAGAAGLVMNFSEAMAAGECASNLSDKALENGVQNISKASADDFSKEFFYWFDGPMIEGMKTAEGAVRGRLATFLNLKLEGYFLETILISDTSRQILDERRFTAASKGTTQKPPYGIFDNLVLNYGMPYHVYFVLSSTGAEKKVIVYRYEIAAEDVRNSRFDYLHLSTQARLRIPKMFLEDMALAGHSEIGKSSNEYGLITTPYQHFAGLPTHIVKVRFANFEQNGNFKAYVQPMHGDVNTFHYMRYFIVTDPVGKFLGVKKRAFHQKEKDFSAALPEAIRGRQVEALTAGGTVDGVVIPGSGLEGYIGVTNGYVPSPFTPAGKDDWAAAFNPYIDPAELSILDCPYVHVVTEDRRDSISKVSIRLR
jgi:hypothetical protein